MIDGDIKSLIKFEKALKSFKLTVFVRKDKTVKIKFGKYVLFTAPSKEWGNLIKMEFEAVIQRKSNMVRDVMACIKANMEQLELELFPNKEGDGDGCQERVEAVGTHLLSGDREDNTGPVPAEKDV